ncbi:hypothetical protein KKA47_01560 [bacterium]|nr:hypothetical protein [bacterium]
MSDNTNNIGPLLTEIRNTFHKVLTLEQPPIVKLAAISCLNLISIMEKKFGNNEIKDLVKMFNVLRGTFTSIPEEKYKNILPKEFKVISEKIELLHEILKSL